ncbi:MAG TPA: hypothetical protein VER33_03000 [Polyangiaceae bacterium]|nr:hypothetical protein [Polyangiaceae bacterium]
MSRTTLKGASGLVSRLRRLGAGLVLVSCGGAVGGPSTGGESHFLRFCDSACGNGLDCISGVCTRGCITGSPSCGGLSKDAVCTADSIEPGAVAVCDVSCTADGDCSSLGSTHRCDAGYCRAPKLGSGGNAGQGAGGSAGVGQAGSGNASAVGGSAGNSSGGLGGLGDGSALLPVFACPEPMPDSDFIQVDSSLLAGDRLSLKVSHSGGCEEHSYGLCYGAFLESSPVQTTLGLIHAPNSDDCQALVTQTLTFDLTPLAEHYARSYATTSGEISTNYGPYTFGELSCERRTQVALAQLSKLDEYLDIGCETDADCNYTGRHTSCSPGCGLMASTRGVAELSAATAAIERGVCTDFEAACDPIAVPPCAPPPQLTCVEEQCVMAEN